MSIKCQDSGIQVGSVLPKGAIYRLGLASDANFNYTVATTFGAPFFFPKKKKKKKKKKTKFSYSSLKSSAYFINKIWDLTNSNDMQFFLTFF